MAKALVGYIGGHDPRLAREALVLRRRVADLEAEIIRLKDRNDSLTTALREQELTTELSTERLLEPALH
ncbi:MAG: hypothetical protein M3386_00675 [Actinomycetota bacterium]|nr:hypothetical protein [Actinomycetota bacterium]